MATGSVHVGEIGRTILAPTGFATGWLSGKSAAMFFGPIGSADPVFTTPAGSCVADSTGLNIQYVTTGNEFPAPGPYWCRVEVTVGSPPTLLYTSQDSFNVPY